MSARSGERLGPYHLRERLGEGGMGVVYLASGPDDQLVAVKILRQGVPGEATARRRLAREVDTMRRVHSPYVAEVIDADVEGDSPYIVTRYVAGRTLEDVVATDGPLTREPLSILIRGLAQALVAIHAAGVVHRDLKPANVMLVGTAPVVIDFGIAQAADSTRLTMTGMFMGTPGYLAPEVIEGGVSGPAADVHAWAATVAYAATGQPPFGTGQFQAIFYRIMHGEPELGTMPLALRPLMLTALARDPAARPSAAELAARAEAISPQVLVPGPASSVTLLAGQAGGLAGAGLAGEAAAAQNGGQPVPAARTAVDVWPKTAGPKTAWPRTRPLGKGGRDDFADLLTPVRYGGPPAAVGGAAAAGQGGLGGQGGAGQSAAGAPMARAWPPPGAVSPDAGVRRNRLVGPVVLATVLGLIALSVLLPVAGTAATLAVLVLLRAADRTSGWLARRRTGQGRRRTDPVSATAFYPWAVLGSSLSVVVLAPMALLCGAAAATATVLATGADQLPRAGAYAAGAFIACYGLGPGSRPCRRPLRTFYATIMRPGPVAILGSVGLAAIALAVVGAAVTLAPGYWPAGHLGNQLQSLAAGHSTLHHITASVGAAGNRLAGWVAGRF